MNVLRTGDGSDGFLPTEDHTPEDAGPALPQGAPLAGLARLLPSVHDSSQAAAFKKLQFEAESALVQQLRGGLAAHASCLRVILDKLVKRGAREQVFDWFGKLLHSNRRRSQMAYDQLQSGVIVSSSALLFNATRALMQFCEPFRDPSDPKTVRIDLRYMSNTCENGHGGGRFLSTDDKLAPPVHGSDDTEEDSSRTQSWVDARNLARQQQCAWVLCAVLAPFHSSCLLCLQSKIGKRPCSALRVLLQLLLPQHPLRSTGSSGTPSPSCTFLPSELPTSVFMQPSRGAKTLLAKSINSRKPACASCPRCAPSR